MDGPSPSGGFLITSRRRPGFRLQSPDGSPLAFPSRDAAEAVCSALNREDPNDAEPEYQVEVYNPA